MCIPKVRAFVLLVWGWITLTFCAATVAQTNSDRIQPQETTERSNPGLVYGIERIQLQYGPKGSQPHSGLPPLPELLQTKIRLARVEDTYVRPANGLSAITLDLAAGPTPMRVTADGLVAIEEALVQELNRRGFYGVWVTPSTEDIHPRTGEDLREGRKDLTLIIYAAEIKQLRTVAKGTRVPLREAINNPAHLRIADNSPLRPASGGSRGSLFDKAVLDDYVERLNRFPGRSVDAAISSSGEPGGVVLDYLVSEGKPWVAYAQVSNTGTLASGSWRERFGFIDQQLTARDDILTLDYVTADFRQSHAFFGSYEIPLVYPDRVKTKVYGSYTEFTADELGISSENIEGDSGEAGVDLTFTPFTFSGFNLSRLAFSTAFVDFTLGARWQGINVDNRTFGSNVGTDLAIPYAGVSLSSISQKTKLAGGVQLEGNLSSLAGTKSSDLPELGRFDTDRDWMLAKWGMGLSFFLEPLFSPAATQLVHEFSISSRGQYVFANHRLIPQQEELIGGFYSVRGYPEALDTGDTVFVGTAEYRYYLARALRIIPEQDVSIGSKTSSRDQFGNPFRFRAKDAYGRPGWDLILRTFVDGGQSYNDRRRSTETDRNLLSAGVGAELEVGRNLDIRIDYGIALASEKDNLPNPVSAGDGRVHFSATLAW